MLAQQFARVAAGISAKLGGPYHAGAVLRAGQPVHDDGGSIVSPGEPSEEACMVQVDQATEAMRLDNYTEGDVRLLVLSHGLAGGVDTDARVRIDAGPHAGTYTVHGVERDPIGVYFECRGRRVDG